MAIDTNIEPAIETRTFPRDLERMALWFALAVALIQAATTFLFNPGAEGLPLIGSPDSLALRAFFAAILITLVIGSYTFVKGIRARNAAVPPEFERGYKWSVVPITIAAAVVFAVTIAWLFAILDRAFPGAAFNRYTMTLFLSIVSGSVAYMVASRMGQLRASGMLYLGVAFLFGTLLFAGARHENPYWWEYSFSHLGMTPSNSRTIFNVGLIFTGSLLVIWQHFFMQDVRALERRGLITHRTYRIFTVALILVGVMLAMVGLVRFGISPIFNVVHDVAATGTGVVLGVLMIFMWWLNSHYDKIFYYLSYLILAGMVSTVIAMVLGYMGLTGLEFACFVLASIWLVLFFRNTELLIEQVAPESRV
jgi:hypothetical protein